MPTDNQDADAMAGLDLTRQVSPDEILSPEQLDEQTLAAHLLQTQNYAKQQEVSTGDQALNIARGTLTGAAIEQGLTPSFKVDPLFSLDRFKERLADAQKTLPAEYLDGLDRALSDEQFDYLYGRAKSLYQSQQELANAGLGAGVANFAAQIIDPAAWVVGGGIASMAIKSARAAQLGRAGQIAANAAGGALGGVATIGSLDALDLPQAPESYLLAAGFGMSLGAMFGPLGKNPAIAREAGVIHEAGEKLVKEALMLPPPPKQITYAGMKRAEGAVDDVIQVAPEAGQVPARLSPRDVIEAPAPSAEGQPPQASFKTAKGSTYNVHEDGSTSRDKAYRPEHGAAEQGPQPRSETTFYVSADDAVKLGEFQTQGVKKSIEKTSDGRYAVKYLEGPSAGKFEKRTAVTPKTEPEVGLTPVEVWNGGSRVHFGNEIVEVTPAPVAPPSAVQRAVDDVSAALAGEDVNPIPSVQAAADEILNPGQADATTAPSKPSAGLVHENPEAAAEKIEGMARTSRLSADRQRIRDQRIAFEEYRKNLPRKSIDPNSKTIRGYHGTLEDFQKFSQTESRYGGDIYFSATPEQANAHAGIRASDTPQKFQSRQFTTGGRVIPVEIDASDFKHISMKGYEWASDTGERLAQETVKARSEGFKGLVAKDILDDGGVADQIVVWTPGTVKSSISDHQWFSKLPPAQALRKASDDELLAAIKEARPTLPGVIGMEVVDDLSNLGGETAAGVFKPREWLIQVARGMSSDARNIINHEVIHGLRFLGLFKHDEWSTLAAAAEKEKWFPPHLEKIYRDEYRAQWQKLGVDVESPEGLAFLALDTKARLTEEGVAYRYGEWAAGRMTVDAKMVTVFQRIKDFLANVGEKLRRLTGHENAEDIFHDIRRGNLAKRYEGGPAPADASVESFAVGAQRNPAVTHDWTQDPSWRSIRDGDVAHSAGFWRFDNAGISGQSDNAPERLIGTSLLNDSVGKADHSLNPFSADQDYRRIMNVYQGEFHKTARPAFQDWADDLNLSTAQRIMREHEFFELAGRYMRDRNRQPGDYHPAVARLGDKTAALHKEILEDLQNPLRREGLQGRPTHGSVLVPEDEHFLWRKFSHDKVRGAVDQQTGFGQTGVIRMLTGSIRSAQQGIDNDLAERLARGYLMNIHSRAVGLGDEWSMALSRGDYDHFHRILTTTSNLTADEADDIVARLSRHRPEGDMANLKRRMLLDETYVERNLPRGQQGEVADLAFNDLLEDNLNNVFSHYLRRASGRIALGRVRVQHPDGSVLINGIVSDREIDNVLRMTQQWGLDNGQLPVHAAESVERLRFAFDRILGIPDPRQSSSMGQWLRLTRAYMSTRLMGQVGIAQLGESGAAVGTLGLRSLFQHVPAFRRVMDAAGDIRNNIPLMEELEAMGIGVERLHGLHYHNLDEVGELPFDVAGKPRMERVLNNARSLENLTYEASGMSLIQQRQEMWVAGNMASKIANMAARLQAGNGLGRGDIRRLAQLGIDEPMMARIMNEMRHHTDATEGMFFGRKVNRLNADRWTDLEARAALENALFRSTKKIIQSGDEGSAAFWMSNPIAQTIFQFRGFAFTAWNNQLLYNIHMGDPAALATFVTSVGWSAAVRAAQISLLAAARSDGEEYKEKYLTPWELGKAGFQRAGWSSIIPMGIDSGLALAGQPGMFNARTTGQASDLIFGNPAMSFMDNAAKGIGGSVNALAEGRSPSQGEVRQLVGLAPFSNLMPITAGLSYLIQDLPERSPRRRINY